MIGGNKKDIYSQKKSENKGKYKGETENCHVICDYDLCMYVCMCMCVNCGIMVLFFSVVS